MPPRYAAAALLFLLIRCDQDPFGCAIADLPGPYGLEQWEDEERYNLRGPGEQEQYGGGVLRGTVLKIGWNSRYIVAERYANFRGDPDGWMIVNVATREVTGPVAEDQWRQNANLKNITVRSAATAWQSQPKCRSAITR